VLDKLTEQDIAFESPTEKIDITRATGSLIFHIFASLAEFERALIKERTNAGLSAARARGHVGGRPKKLTAKKIEATKILIDAQTLSMKDIVGQYGFSRDTLYRSVSHLSIAKSR
jgi:DNA invertase Pin-like site-specific DNA recombinase